MAFKFGSPTVALSFEGDTHTDAVTVYLPLDERTTTKIGKAGKALAECKETAKTTEDLKDLVRAAVTLVIGQEDADKVFALNPQAGILQYTELFGYITSTFIDAYSERVATAKARTAKPVIPLAAKSAIAQDYMLGRAQPNAMARMMAAMEAAGNEPAD